MSNGRFRKGKKAFKRNRAGKLFNQYLIHLERIRQRRIGALNASMAGLVAAMGMNRIALIQATRGTKLHKALSIAHEVINMSQAIPKAFQAFS